MNLRNGLGKLARVPQALDGECLDGNPNHHFFTIDNGGEALCRYLAFHMQRNGMVGMVLRIPVLDLMPLSCTHPDGPDNRPGPPSAMDWEPTLLSALTTEPHPSYLPSMA